MAPDRVRVPINDMRKTKSVGRQQMYTIVLNNNKKLFLGDHITNYIYSTTRFSHVYFRLNYTNPRSLICYQNRQYIFVYLSVLYNNCEIWYRGVSVQE